jgi:biopolymer transport protein ExbB/TolQ
MGSLFQQIGFYLTHPEAMLYTVAGVLLYPALVVLAAALCYIVYEFGRFTIEMLMRDRRRSLLRMEETAKRTRYYLSTGANEDALAHFEAMSTNWLHQRFIAILRQSPDLGHARLAKVLAETELTATRRLDRTRMWIRLGPIIGLMTTLIPISPALVALAKGDLQTLSANLVTAFTTTVISLLVSGLAFVISANRERVYMQDVGDIEYALERMEG